MAETLLLRRKKKEMIISANTKKLFALLYGNDLEFIIVKARNATKLLLK
jgi:hypothetical protein